MSGPLKKCLKSVNTCFFMMVSFESGVLVERQKVRKSKNQKVRGRFLGL